MRMEARSAGGGYVSAEYAVYDSNPARGEGARRPFRADAGGVLEWLDFTELDDKGDHGGYPYNWSPEMETTAARLGLSGTKREVMMDLVLTQLGFGETVRLPGPTVRIPDRIWHAEPPKPNTLGLFDALNPFEKGSGSVGVQGMGTASRSGEPRNGPLQATRRCVVFVNARTGHVGILGFATST